MTTGFETSLKLIPKINERFKAAYDPLGTAKPKRQTFYPGQYSWKSRCAHYDKLTDSYSLAKVAPFTLAGLVTATGVFFKPSEKKPQKKTVKKDAVAPEDNSLAEQDTQTYALAEEAQYRAEKLWREQRGNGKFYETAWRMAKYGGCFWEVTTEPTFGWRIPTLQECIEPYEADDQGNITKWRQIVGGTTTAVWDNTQLILVPFLGVITATWPYAPSIYMGTETELEMLTGVEESVKDYSKKQAWPYELLQLGDAANPVSDEEYNQARSEWKNRQPGEGIVSTVPSEILAGGTGSSPIRELAVICELMKDNLQDAVMIAPISKLYNATEASAKELTKHVMTVLGQPMQWRLAEYFESYVLKPWLEASGFSRKSCPQTVFESPDVHKEEEGQYWTSLVSAKIQSPQQACEHLGLEYDEAFFAAEEQKQQEQFQQKLDSAKQAPFGNSKEEPKKPGMQKAVQELRETLSSCTEQPDFMKRCSRIVGELVADPEDFCGAFWQDREQWYHGPQKVTLKEPPQEAKEYDEFIVKRARRNRSS